ncbi:MAG: EAL domain-containing protein [Burkholderiales bacterium]|nr:EAL domain-containing protein [Burkholderiales bacterium]
MSIFERLSETVRAALAALWRRQPESSPQLLRALQEAHDARMALKDMAHRDPLTGLANRLLFEDRLDGVIRRAEQAGDRFSVLFIDLDGFRPINESYGHLAGDAVLREVGRRLDELARQSDTVARVGSDQFLMLVDGNPETSAAAVVASRVRSTLAQPMDVGGRGLKLSCSIGIVLYPDHGPRAKLIAHAEAAMIAAKEAGGGLHAFFEERMEANSEEQLNLQSDLRHAIEHGAQGLSLDYQPKINSKTGRLTGVEALLRWQHPQHGAISPLVFVPVAERFGLIAGLGQWVIEETCRQLRIWQDEGLDLRVAINLSVHQLRQGDLVERIEQALNAHRINPDRIMFEVAESVAMADSQASHRLFEQFLRLGVQVSIDDFGGGHASLSQLRKLPAGQLKIDHRLVRDMAHDADAKAVVDAAVRLSHALGMDVVAKGVETAHQQNMLLSYGCDELQGDLVGKPMPGAQMATWAHSSEAVPRPRMAGTSEASGEGHQP